MVRSQTKRAVQARKCRDTAREKRRINNVLAEYVRHKHANIYNECYELYKALKKKYPNLGPKCDLTKTTMFKRLIEKDLDTSSSSDEECSVAGNNFTATASNHSVPAVDSSDIFTATISNPAADSNANLTATTSEPIPVPADDSNANLTATTSEPIPVPAVDSNDILSETINEPVPAASIPVQHLHINYNSLGEIVENLIDEGEYVNMNALNNELLQDIINDLEHDESIHEILNDVHPMEQQEDVDEGIVLNLQNEVEELLGFDLEYDF